MDGYSISQAAERTGFAPSALRFYERSGLVSPARTPAGYRTYDDGHLELLRFIGRAKGFGLSLEEITELLALLDQERCAPVQDRLRELVAAKINEAQIRVAELVTFTAELQQVAAILGRHTPDGPCDGACGCNATAIAPDVNRAALFATPEPGAYPPIVCTLDPTEAPQRLADWQAVVRAAASFERITGGVRLRLGPDADVGAVAKLAAAEQACCRFFTFTLALGDATTLDVTGGADAEPLIEALFCGANLGPGS